MSRIFLSHSSVNNAAAIALANWLSEQGLDDVFLDVDPDRGITPGERWQEALKAASDRCEAVLFLISSAWLASKWCLAEFLLAKTLHKKIFGLLIEQIPVDQLPPEMTSEWQLCKLAGDNCQLTFEVTVGEKREQITFCEAGLELLRRGLRQAGLDAHSFAWPPPGEPRREPYRGLRPLEPQDAAIFFGRDASIVRGLDELRGLMDAGVEKMLVILGASGSGKSSFLRAGLWPRLARDDDTFVPLPIIRPSTAVISGHSGLAAAVSATFERLGKSLTPGRVKEMLGESRTSLKYLLSELCVLAEHRLVPMDGTRPRPAIVISIDQAEELFHADSRAEATPFLDCLAEVLSDVKSRCLVIATMRSDRYTLLQADPSLATIKRRLFDLGPIPVSEFKGIIEGPARRIVESGGRLAFDPALTEQLIADSTGADALPLLGFTLERLYADYGGEGRLTKAEYQKMGGVQGSIEAAVVHALAKPHQPPQIPMGREAQLAPMRRAFIPWLARIDPTTGAALRRLARLDEIPQESHAIVERLIEARLLVADRREGVDVIEVAHESLLRRWPALAVWLEADADDLKIIEAVEGAAREWARNGRNEAWLDHRAERLTSAETVTAREDFRQRLLSSESSEYLSACKTAELKEKDRENQRQTVMLEASRRLVRRTFAGLVVASALAIVAVGAGAYAVVQQHTARENAVRAEQERDRALLGESRFLSNLADQQAELGDLTTGLLLALEALPDGDNDDPVKRKRPYWYKSEVFADKALRMRQVLSVRHENQVNTVKFSPDGLWIATGASDRSARIWDATTGQEKISFKLMARVNAVAFSPDGSRIVVGTSKNEASVWNIADGKRIMMVMGDGTKQDYFSNGVTAVGVSADSTKIVTGTGNAVVKVWDIATGNLVTELSKPQNDNKNDQKVTSVSFSPDQLKVLASFWNGDIHVWNIAEGTLVELKGHRQRVFRAVFSSDGSRILSGSSDETARVWNATTGQQVSMVKVDCLMYDPYTTPLFNNAFTADGTRFATACNQNRQIRIWEVATGRLITTLLGHAGSVDSIDFSPDGLRLVSGAADYTARVWDVRPSQQDLLFVGQNGKISSVASSVQGDVFATGADDRTIRIWNAATGNQLAVLNGHEGAITDLKFSKNGEFLLSASADNTARVWNWRSGQQTAILNGHTGTVWSAALSPDDNLAVTGSADGTIRIWDIRNSLQLYVMSNNGAVLSVAFSSDGTMVAGAGSDKIVRLWSPEAGRDYVKLEGHTAAVYSVSFSPDDALLATSSEDGTTRLWDRSTGKERFILKGHEGAIFGVAFSPDGSSLVTGGADRTARVWSVMSGLELAILRGHMEGVSAVTFSADGGSVLTGSDDKTSRRWPMPVRGTQRVINLVKQGLFRCLTPLQRERFQLEEEPPHWCITGVGAVLENATSWHGVWPYQTEEWKQWLIRKRAGRDSILPSGE